MSDHRRYSRGNRSLSHGAHDIYEIMGQYKKNNGRIDASNDNSHAKANVGGALPATFANLLDGQRQIYIRACDNG